MSENTSMPSDNFGRAIPALRFKPNGSHKINVTAVSTKNTVPFDENTRVVSLYASAPVYVCFGASTVVADATCHYFPGGIYYDVAIGVDKESQATHVAVIRAEGDCTLYISEKV